MSVPVPVTTQPGRQADGLFAAPHLREAIGSALLFAVFTVAWTWPLAAQPASAIRGLNDPYLFAWILGWVSENLFTNPRSLFDANIFWPWGLTLAWSEPMIFQAATVGAPAHWLSGNPILGYNLSQLVFQTVSGWCAWYVTRRITGSTAGALIAGIVFALSPFKTGYYQYLNIHLSFAVPLAFLTWYQFLQSQRWKYLGLTVLLLWIQALSIWYGTIPLVLVLGLLTLVWWIMRPGQLSARMIGKLVAAALVTGILIAPIALPYLQTRNELGFERTLAEIIKFRADLLSFLDAGRWHFFHQWADSKREPGLMPGLAVWALAILATAVAALAYLRRPTTSARPFRMLGLGTAVLFAALIALLCWHGTVPEARGGWLVLPLLIGLLITVIALLGRSRLDADRAHTGFSQGEWIGVTALFALVGMLLALGPVVHVNGEAVGHSPYLWIYKYFPGFKGLRISFRLAFVFLFFIGLLAALGLAWLQARNRAWSRSALIIPVIVLAEYSHTPLEYTTVDWNNPPAAYQYLAERRGNDDNGALLELPTFNENIDSTYVFWSLLHKRPLVNGVSGFASPLSANLASAIHRLPATGDIAALAEVDGLRYLKVNPKWIRDGALRRQWRALAKSPPPGLTFIRKFDDSLLFAIDPAKSHGTFWRRYFASRDLGDSRALKLIVAMPGQTPGVTHQLDLMLNGSPIGRYALDAPQTAITVPLPDPLTKAAPVVVSAQQNWTRTVDVDDRYRIGTSATRVNADIVVQSAGAAHGDRAGIFVNGRNMARRHPGYNLVAIDPVTGRVTGQGAFDLKRPKHVTAMATWLNNRPVGEVVVVALRRSVPLPLAAPVREALASIGAMTEPAGPTASHIIIGVAGAPAGTAWEATRTTASEHVVGQDRRMQTMQISVQRLPKAEEP